MKRYHMLFTPDNHYLEILQTSMYSQKLKENPNYFQEGDFGDFYSNINTNILITKVSDALKTGDYFFKTFRNMDSPIILKDLEEKIMIEDRFYLSNIYKEQNRVCGIKICLPYFKEIYEKNFELKAYSRIADKLVQILTPKNISKQGSLQIKNQEMLTLEDKLNRMAEILLDANPHLRVH